MAESLGVAKIDLLIDTDQWNASIERGKNDMAQFGQAAEAAHQGADTAAKRSATNLLRQLELIGKTREEALLLRAAWAGVDASILDPIREKLAANAAAARDYADDVRKVAAAHEEAARINAAFDSQRADNAQLRYAQEYAGEVQRSSQYLEEQARVVRALTLQAELREAHESRITAELAKQHAEALTINQAFAQARATNFQNDLNSRLGITDRSGDLSYLAEQRGAVARLTEEYNRLEAAEARAASNAAFIQSQERSIATFGKTRSEVMEYEARIRGLTREMAPLIARQKELERQMYQGGVAFNQYGLSQKQMAAAMRGVPAQITDIVVSLQGGQAPLTVLLQQGGQLKDMFGGIRPAVGALASQLFALITPVTLVGGAMAALTVAGLRASSQQDDIVIALARTGGQAERSADDVIRAARRISSEVEGVSNGIARDAMSEVIGSGRIAAESIDLVAEATARWSAVTGDKVSDVVDRYEEIAKDPVKALLKLNETENFLTRAQLDRVQALVDEKREQEAVALATEYYAEVQTRVVGQITAQLSEFKILWMDIKEIISSVGDAIGFVGNRALGMARENFGNVFEFIGELGEIGSDSNNSPLYRIRRLTEAVTGAAGRMADTYNRAGTTAKQAFSAIGPAEDIVDSAAETERIKRETEAKKTAEQDWTRFAQQNLDVRAKQQAEEKRIIDAGKLLGKSEAEVNAQLTESRARFAEAESKRNAAAARRANAAKPGESTVKSIRDTIAANEEALLLDTKMTASQRLHAIVMAELGDAGSDWSASMKEQIRAMLPLLQASGEKRAAHEKEIVALEKLNQLETQIAVRRETMLQANANDVTAFFSTADEMERAARRLAIEQNYAKEVADLRKQGLADDSDAFRRQMDALRAARDEEYEIEAQHQERLVALREDWQTGALMGIEDFIASTADSNRQIRETVQGGLRDFTNNVVAMSRTGKFAAKDMVTGFLEEIFRLVTNKAFANVANMLMSGGGQWTGTFGSLFGSAWGFAKGDVKDGSKGLSKYSNGIYDTPQFFAFAKGAAMGVFGEAGAEAIMPVARTSDGKLGVHAVGGGGIPSVNVNVYGVNEQPQVSTSMGSDGAMNIDVLFGQFEGRMAERMGSGVGPMAAVQKNVYGNRRR